MTLIRLATAGSVDDGKSTLIGRLLLETDSLLEDQLSAVEEASARRGEALNLALVTDGLRAEREQNITIDVAYRPFRTGNRRFILADSPGHTQYTRNMATAASTADVVIVLVDASKGQTSQSRRHLAIASLLGAPGVVLAVNKMDLVGYEKSVFDELTADLMDLANRLGDSTITAIPISALLGDNVATRSMAMPWYEGPTFLEFLETVELSVGESAPSRLPVQNVLRGPDQSRFFAGTLIGSPLRVGQSLESSSGQRSQVRCLLSSGVPAEVAQHGTPIAVQLEDEIDVSRGDWLFVPDEAPVKARNFTATLFWMQPDALRLGMNYRLRQGPRVLPAKITEIHGLLNLENATYGPTGSVAMNDIATVEMELAHETCLESYSLDRNLGSFILIDASNQTMAAGRIDGISTQPSTSLRQRGCALWLTGLSGAGKSTLAEALVEELRQHGTLAFHLDGDTLRSGLCSDLGFSADDRLENIRRTAEVARLLADQGFVVVCSLISPLLSQREAARQILQEAFLEVYVKCDLEECIRRDPKGLYVRALGGQIPNFTGVSAPYEPPVSPNVIVDTQLATPAESVKLLIQAIGEQAS